MPSKESLILGCVLMIAGCAGEVDPPGVLPDALFPVPVDDRYGYMNFRGEIVIDPQFDGAAAFVDGLAIVIVDDAWGYIDRKGRMVIPPRFEYVAPFHHGIAVVKENDAFGFIDTTGEYIIGPKFSAAQEFAANGLAAVQNPETELYGYIDRQGRFAIEPVFQSATPFSDGFALVVGPDGSGGLSVYLIDEDGENMVLPFDYENVRRFDEGLAAVLVDGTWGYIDTRGDLVIPPAFSHAGPFSEGMAFVRGSYDTDLGYRAGYIDTEGNLVFTLDDKIHLGNRFKEGRAVVRTAAESLFDHVMRGYVDTEGNYVVRPRYHVASQFHDGLAWVESDEWAGYIDRNGNEVWSTQSSR